MVDKNVSSRETIAYARDFVLKIMLKKVLIERNYRTLAVEANANEKSYNRYLEIIEEDSMSLERDIEIGRMSTGRYSGIINLKKEKKELYQRDDIAIEILDDIICKRNKIEMLKLYPILQKEYNMDGTKKSASELIQNMLSEIKSILGNKELSEEEQKLVIKDTKFMYYELIYRALEKITSEEIFKIEQQIGKDKSIKIFNNMQQYFQKEMEIKIINTYNKKEMSAEEFIKTECSRYLPQNGEITLKDGSKISAKQYVEQYMLQINEYDDKEYTLYKQLEDNVQSQNPWTIQKETKERLTKYYEAKKQLIGEVIDKVNKNKENKMLGE